MAKWQDLGPVTNLRFYPEDNGKPLRVFKQWIDGNSYVYSCNHSA